jgi:hypothetical protein
MGANAPVRDLVVWDDGTGPAVYATGEFTSIGGIGARGIARWNGTNWSTLGGGLTGPSATGIVLFPWTIAGAPVLLVGGYFDHAGGQFTPNIAVWDGTQWSPFGIGFDSAVWDLKLCDLGSGPELYAGGGFGYSGPTFLNHVGRWDGSQWQPLGIGVAGHLNRCYALQAYDDGSGPALFAAGSFLVAGGNPSPGIAKWNGVSWSSLGGGIPLSGIADAVLDLEVFDPGTGPVLYACGEFYEVDGNSSQRLAGWDGTWHTFPFPGGLNGQTFGMTTLDDGAGPALYFGGYFDHAGGVPAFRVARWNGSVYSALDAGVGTGNSEYVQRVRGLADIAGGASDLWVGGTFTVASGEAAKDIARWDGCDGPGTMLCFGDDSSPAPCPCANSGAPGHGCQNSATTGGALLSSSGTTNPDALVLTTQGELASVLSIVLQGDATIAPVAFGDGLRCAGGNLVRLYAVNAVNGVVQVPGSGDPSISARSAQLGDPLGSGSRRTYQTYYRDSDATFCPSPQGDTWNVSNAVRIVW